MINGYRVKDRRHLPQIILPRLAQLECSRSLTFLFLWWFIMVLEKSFFVLTVKIEIIRINSLDCDQYVKRKLCLIILSGF